MGQLRVRAIYANPRLELCGIVDANVDAAAKLGEMYRVSISRVRIERNSNVFLLLKASVYRTLILTYSVLLLLLLFIVILGTSFCRHYASGHTLSQWQPKS